MRPCRLFNSLFQGCDGFFDLVFAVSVFHSQIGIVAAQNGIIQHAMADGSGGQCGGIVFVLVNHTVCVIQSSPEFMIRNIGCGNAGYSVKEVAPHFKRCMLMENVSLPEDFWAILGLKMKF